MAGIHGLARILANPATSRPWILDRMKWLTTLDVVAYAAPQSEPRSNAAMKRGPAMDHIDIDLHKKESQICVLGEGGRVEGAADPHHSSPS